MKKLIAGVLGVVFLGVAGLAVFMVVLSSELPEIITLEDYSFGQ